ncbi:MAG: bifunctional NADH-specific enoyl-ACP reductase/trans-2-enoyl-CoA reductase, partial [Candidatus Cloacimonetes bacterium]|nr:bifunctional NADH-specific enoyl-ACP reductase/trans-2-enoyl-CoA reductase [Candidatus Cloacimonadota bacterium]
MSREIALAKAQGGQRSGGSALVVGASSGYGLASRITAAFSHGMNTLGIAFEKEPRGARTGTAGWYNMAAFRQQAEAEGLRADNVNADAFSRETLEDAIARIRKDFGKLNLFVYSVAAPRRTDPATGEEYRSALKTTASVYETRFLDVSKGTLSPASFEPATEEEIRGTVKVMGGEDLERWVNALL